jgi:hypothetical protein
VGQAPAVFARLHRASGHPWSDGKWGLKQDNARSGLSLPTGPEWRGRPKVATAGARLSAHTRTTRLTFSERPPPLRLWPRGMTRDRGRPKAGPRTRKAERDEERIINPGADRVAGMRSHDLSPGSHSPPSSPRRRGREYPPTGAISAPPAPRLTRFPGPRTAKPCRVIRDTALESWRGSIMPNSGL